MVFKGVVLSITLSLLLSGCMRWLPDSMRGQHGMDHSQMKPGTMQHTMPKSDTAGDTMPMNHDHAMGDMQGMMDGTTPADAAAMTAMMNQMAQMHSAMPHNAPHHTGAEAQGHMGEMMALMQQMHDMMASGALPANAEQMTQMQAMMHTMHGLMGSTAMTGTMPMQKPMAGMDHGNMHSNMHSNMHGSETHVDPALPFDAQFIDSMIVHHQGAVTMATELLEQSDRPEMQAFAAAIISAQSSEISDMQRWRQEWYPDLAATTGMDMAMGDMVVSSDESKPYDQRFLEAMISHHQGAIEMAEMALQLADHAEIKTLAAAVIEAQTTEIEQMKGWLQAWFGVTVASQSPYVAQLASPVRGLSRQEVADLQAGHGMGFARMAELNSYPGPRHLLDLQAELELAADQVTQIEAIFAAMSAEAKTLGAAIVEAEAELSMTFADGTINEATLAEQVAQIAEQYGQLRLIHLRAHLQVAPLLTAEQIAKYDDLRGYTAGGDIEHHGMDHGN